MELENLLLGWRGQKKIFILIKVFSDYVLSLLIKILLFFKPFTECTILVSWIKTIQSKDNTDAVSPLKRTVCVGSPSKSNPRSEIVAVHRVEHLRELNSHTTTQQTQVRNNSERAVFLIAIPPLRFGVKDWGGEKRREARKHKKVLPGLFGTSVNKNQGSAACQSRKVTSPRTPLFFAKLHSSKNKATCWYVQHIHIYREDLFFLFFPFLQIDALYVHACMYPAPPFSGLLLNPDSQTSVYTIGAWGCWQEKRGEGLLAAVQHGTDRDSPRRDPQSARRNSRLRGKAKANSLQKYRVSLQETRSCVLFFSVHFLSVRKWRRFDPNVSWISSSSHK